jgi:hypothetical protein
VCVSEQIYRLTFSKMLLSVKDTDQPKLSLGPFTGTIPEIAGFLPFQPLFTGQSSIQKVGYSNLGQAGVSACKDKGGKSLCRYFR